MKFLSYIMQILFDDCIVFIHISNEKNALMLKDMFSSFSKDSLIFNGSNKSCFR